MTPIGTYQKKARNRMETRGNEAQVAALYAALAKAQAEFPPIVKASEVNYGANQGGRGAQIQFKYADYEAIRAAVMPVLGKHGLSLRQPFETYDVPEGERMGQITTILSHADGGAEISVVTFKPADSIKDLGGQTTYLRRYQINCQLGLGAAEDAEEDPKQQYEGAPGLGKGQKKAPAKPAPQKQPEPNHELTTSPAKLTGITTKVGGDPPQTVGEPDDEGPPPHGEPDPVCTVVPKKYSAEQREEISALIKELVEIANWKRETVMLTLQNECGVNSSDELTEELAVKFIAYLRNKVVMVREAQRAQGDE